MMWFGPSCGAPYEADTERVTAPVGALCVRCNEVIGWHDSGLVIPYFTADKPPEHKPYHYECHLRGIVGGLNHQMRRCTCCGGSEPPDPPELSPRDAARVAVNHWHIQQR